MVCLGHSVYNIIAVPSDESQSLLVLSLGDVGTDGEQDDLASFVRSHARLRRLLVLEPEHAVDSLQAARVVSVQIAGSGQRHPVLHGRRLEQEHLAARFLEALEITQVHLQLDQFAHRHLVVRVALKGEQVGTPGLIILPIRTHRHTPIELNLAESAGLTYFSLR